MYFKIYIFVAVNIILTANAARRSSSSGTDSLTTACKGKQYWDNGFKSYKALQPFAFGNIDETVTQLCTKSKIEIKSLASNEHCMQPNQKQFFTKLIDGFTAMYDFRCSNKTWKEDYVKYQKCFKSENVSQSLRNCVDKVSVLLVYIGKNVPKNDQGKIMCCNAPVYTACVTEVTKKGCGDDAAPFAVQNIMGPLAAPFGYLCQGMTPDICTKYPKVIEVAKKAFAAQQVSPYGNIYKYIMLIAKNSLDG